MKLEEIKKTLTFEKILIEGEGSDTLKGITDPRSLSESCLLVIGNRNILNLIKESNLNHQYLIVDEKIYQKNEEYFTAQTTKFTGVVKNAEHVIPKLSELFYKEHAQEWNNEVDGRQMGTVDIDPSAYIAQNVFIGSNVKIGPQVKIHPGVTILSNCSLDESCEIFPQVVLYPNVHLKKNVRIHGGSIIGADGFGYTEIQGVHHKIWHMGGVQVEENVEIGANSCVDGGTFSPTIIGEGSKLDNHVQIGHNCILGKGVIICGHVAIGGSSEIGDYTVFGGKSGMGHGMKLGPLCQVAGGALVNRDWEKGSVLGGHPARPLKEWMRGLAYVRNQVSQAIKDN